MSQIDLIDCAITAIVLLIVFLSRKYVRSLLIYIVCIILHLLTVPFAAWGTAKTFLNKQSKFWNI